MTIALSDPLTFYKITTHDLRPPIQGGDPLWHDAYTHGLATALPTGPDELRWVMEETP